MDVAELVERFATIHRRWPKSKPNTNRGYWQLASDFRWRHFIICEAAVRVTKFLYCGLDKHSNVFPDERVSFCKVLLALDCPQEIENIDKHQVEEPEFEFDLAALFGKLPLQRLDFVEGRPQVCGTIASNH
jgi:hypothetical protein